MARVYIAGPIAGKPNNNVMMFHEAATRLVRMGFEPVSPLHIGIDPHLSPDECKGDPVGTEGHSYGCYMIPDLKALLDCDGYTLLPFWQKSRGARVESQVAQICGIPYIATFPVLRPDAFQLYMILDPQHKAMEH